MGFKHKVHVKYNDFSWWFKNLNIYYPLDLAHYLFCKCNHCTNCEVCYFHSTKPFCNLIKHGCFLQAPRRRYHYVYTLVELVKSCPFKKDIVKK